jgi:hypothetical protein
MEWDQLTTDLSCPKEIMAKHRYYSPRLDRTLISPLYHEAKRQQIPMTKLASRFVEEGLLRSRDQNIVAEEPVAADPRDRVNSPDH